ncbi:MAG: ADP-ribosylglycohydrolase family protein [Phycisphaerae bacterium]
MMQPVSQDRFLGCLLGHAVGDAVGAPFEGLTSDLIYNSFGRTTDIIAKPPVEQLVYTDDTQMMIGLAETLLAHGRVNEDALCQAFVANYDPRRGYGTGTRRLLESLPAHPDWRSQTKTIFPDGSFGNGGAMRVSPVGLLFCDNLDRVAEEADRSAAPTHAHPLGIEGARLMAVAIALAAREPVFDRRAFYQQLWRYAREEEFRWQLQLAVELTDTDSLRTLGNSLEAHRSVVTAIACFTTSPDSYVHTIARALAQGNDTDTLAAMAGAISGAHLGVDAVPGHLRALLEDEDKGRSYITGLATRLHQVYLRAYRA